LKSTNTLLGGEKMVFFSSKMNFGFNQYLIIKTHIHKKGNKAYQEHQHTADYA